MLKLVVETGSGSHTTSSALMQVKYRGGKFDGQYLYQQKQFQVKAEWQQARQNEKWVVSEYSLPEGTEIQIIGSGRTGYRGTTRHDFNCIYRLDPTAEVQEFYVNVGLRECLVKGRMVLVKDLVAQKVAARAVDTEEGF